MNHGQIKSERETIYFVLCAVYSGIIYLIAAISIIGIGIALAFLAVVLFSNAMMLGSVRGNGVRINDQQFPDVYERVKDLSAQMGIKQTPDVFVIQSEGYLNAFATRFFGRNMVVLYSEVFELAREQGEKELDFIIAHELSHIKRRHVWKSILVMPAQLMPFLAQAYSRSCEYTCDREAAFMIQDGTAAKRALTILGIGKLLYKEVNEDAYLEQIHSESNVAVWLSEVLSTHPRLPKRIQSVGQFMSPETTPLYYPKTGKIALGASLLFGGIFVAYIAVIVSITMSGIAFSSVFSDLDLDDSFAYEDAISESPLLTAVIDGNVSELEELIANGEDLEQIDEEGTTALHYTVYMGDPDMAEMLLEAGANPNTEDISSTPLTLAISSGYEDLAWMLYYYGADPAYEDANGDSGYSLLGVSNEDDFIEVLGY